MKNISRVILSAAAALGLVASAEASYVNGDLLLGFTGGSSDFILDLGSYSSLTSGETWSVGANLGTQFGVVGTLNLGQLVYATSASSTENGFNPTGLFQSARANVATLAQGSLVQGSSLTLSPSLSYSWTYQTAQAVGTPGNTFQNNFLSPNVAADSTAYLFQNANNGAVTLVDTFTYNNGSGQLTVTATPEPGTLSLLVVMGLAGLALHRLVARRAK